MGGFGRVRSGPGALYVRASRKLAVAVQAYVAIMGAAVGSPVYASCALSFWAPWCPQASVYSYPWLPDATAIVAVVAEPTAGTDTAPAAPAPAAAP